MDAILIIAGIAGLLLYMKGKAAESQSTSTNSVSVATSANTQAPIGNIPPMHPIDPVTGIKTITPLPNPVVPNKFSPIGRYIWDVNLNRRVGPRDPALLYCGGGGPENLGAIPVNDQVRLLPLTQPSWMFESDAEYIGYARPSNTPLLAGGDNFGNQPQDAFRFLGDKLGSRG